MVSFSSVTSIDVCDSFGEEVGTLCVRVDVALWLGTVEGAF